MTSLNIQDIELAQGKTFRRVVRWESDTFTYAAISAITKTAPVSITATAHGIPDGWRAAVVSVLGMLQINATNTPPRDSEYHTITVADANTVTINAINAAEYSTYSSGGYLQYRAPKSLANYTARMQIKDQIGGTVLASLTTENGGITLDDTAKTISLFLGATATAAYTWLTGVYDLELVSQAGDVFLLLSGSITLTQEVTT